MDDRLESNELMQLKYSKAKQEGKSHVSRQAGGLCIDFNAKDKNM